MQHLLDIDPAAAAPIWRQIEDGMRRLVVSGRLPAGEAIPSVRDLSKALRVNPATVSKAYRRLGDAGLLTVRRGEGTFVAALTPPVLAAERRRLLQEGTQKFLGLARTIGASQEEVLRAIDLNWIEITEGGEGDDR